MQFSTPLRSTPLKAAGLGGDEGPSAAEDGAGLERDAPVTFKGSVVPESKNAAKQDPELVGRLPSGGRAGDDPDKESDLETLTKLFKGDEAEARPPKDYELAKQ